MFSGLIPGLNSVNSTDDEFAGQIPALLIAVRDLPEQLLSIGARCWINACFICRGLDFPRRDWSDFGGPLERPTLFLWAGIVVMIGLISWSYLSEEEGESGSDTVAPPKNDGEAAAALGSIHRFEDAISFPNGDKIVQESDAKYAEELQLQEALMASLLSSRMDKDAILPAIQSRTALSLNGEPSQSFCGICFEDKEHWQMFTNESCSHSFCCDCTSKHIAAKIQNNMKAISCPGVDCKAPLDFNACRQIIPNEVLVRWDETLCKSLILESQTVYCPFRDCSAMLVNDSEEVIKEIACPACHRQICAWCVVPWHVEFTCEEFQKLSAKKKGKEDDGLAKELAKKKSWRKCPNCKMYVEKTAGCLHITCRCGCEFCYVCGAKWAVGHQGCSQRP